MSIFYSIYNWDLYHKINETASKQKFYIKMENYIPRDDSDDLNPQYLFSLTANDLLVAIMKGQIDPVELASKELKNRGLNIEGEWIGFKKG